MSNYQFDVYTMFLAVITYLSKIQHVMSKSPPLVEAYGRFQAVVAQITIKYADVSDSTAGDVEIKHTLREKLEILLDHAIVSLRSYAIAKQLTALFDSVRLKDWQLSLMRDDELLFESNHVIKLCDANTPDAFASEFTAEDVEALKTGTTDFSNAIGEKTTGQSESTTATESLASLVRTASTILKREMDEHFAVLKKNYRAEFELYKTNRKIVHTGGRRKKGNGDNPPDGGTTPPTPPPAQ